MYTYTLLCLCLISYFKFGSTCPVTALSTIASQLATYRGRLQVVYRSKPQPHTNSHYDPNHIFQASHVRHASHISTTLLNDSSIIVSGDHSAMRQNRIEGDFSTVVSLASVILVLLPTFLTLS